MSKEGIFNKDHYPTPSKTIDKMIVGLPMWGKMVLEPSVGSGNIVEHLQGMGADIIGCEIDPELRKLAPCRLIAEDFLTVKSDQVSHVDYIIMNPPFSADEKHILHAWNIAPDGCEIRAICNWETIRNSYSKKRQELASIIKEYGKAECFGREFMDDAERTTLVEIGYVELTKPKRNGEDEDEFHGFFMTDAEEEAQEEGIQRYNWVRDLVNRYVGAVKIFDEQLETANRMNELTKGFFNAQVGTAMVMGKEKNEVTRDTYKKELQKSAWSYAFKKFKMDKYVTKSVKDDLNRFIEQNQAYPFTMVNIYKMIEILILTVGNRMDKALLEVFDKLTSHTHENRWNVEGWKTNSNYLVNEKFIMGNLCQIGYSGQMEARYDGYYIEILNDFIKALCYITGRDYDTLPTLYQFLHARMYARDKNGEIAMEFEKKYSYSEENEWCFQYITWRDYDNDRYHVQEKFKELCKEKGWTWHERPEWGKWFDFGFFEIRCYKKGTAHFKFKDREVWAKFNQQIARIKGFPLPDIHDEGSKKRNEKARKKKNEEYAGNY